MNLFKLHLVAVVNVHQPTLTRLNAVCRLLSGWPALKKKHCVYQVISDFRSKAAVCRLLNMRHHYFTLTDKLHSRRIDFLSHACTQNKPCAEVSDR